MTVKNLNNEYVEGCREEVFGDLVWHKEKNEKGETIYNILFHDSADYDDMPAIDIFGDEEFDKADLVDNNHVNLYQNGEIIKRYARDRKKIFRPCDENGNIIRPEPTNWQQVTPGELNKQFEQFSAYDKSLRTVATNQLNNFSGRSGR